MDVTQRAGIILRTCRRMRAAGYTPEEIERGTNYAASIGFFDEDEFTDLALSHAKAEES
jgi:hypothetical protein